MDNGLGLNINIKTEVRIRVLYDVVKELCCSFDFPQSVLRILQKGIVERQLLGSIFAYYLDDNDVSVGLVKFNIDWKKHQMYASTSTGKKIAIENDKPLIEQFASWSTDIVNYVKLMQKGLNVKKVHVYYQYTDEINDNPQAVKEANEFLGLTSASTDYKHNQEKAKEFERRMSCISNMLPELEIEISSGT